MAQYLNVPVEDISDLKKIVIKGDRTEEPNLSELDTSDLPPDAARKVKELHNTCVQLRAAVGRLRADNFKSDILLQTLPFIIYSKDRELKYTYVNDSFMNIIGPNYGRKNITGMVSSDLFGGREYLQILELEKKVFRSKQRISNHQIYIPRSNEHRIGLLTIIPTLNEEEEVTEIICSIEDITHTYEEQKRRKEQEEIQRIMIDSINKMDATLGIYDLAKKKLVNYLSVRNVFGIEFPANLNENERLHYWIENMVHPDDREEQKKYSENMENLPPVRKYRIIHPKKGIRTIEVNIFKVTTESKKLIQLLYPGI